MLRFIVSLCAAAALALVAAPAQAQGPAVGVRLVADGLTAPVDARPRCRWQRTPLRRRPGRHDPRAHGRRDAAADAVPGPPEQDRPADARLRRARRCSDSRSTPTTRPTGASSSTTAPRSGPGRPPGTTTRPASPSSASRPQIRTGPIRRRSGCCSRSTSRSSITTAARWRSGRATATCTCRSATAAAPTTSASATSRTGTRPTQGGNGQDIQHNLLGDILRIDVNRGAPYAIPADNPFAGTPGCADGCDETWAYGLRNPYRMSFDMGGSRELFVGDSGQNLWEEVEHRRQGRQLRLERQGGRALLLHRQPGRNARRVPRRGRRAAPTSRRPAHRPGDRVPERAQPTRRRPRPRRRGRPRLPRRGAAPVLGRLHLRRLEPRGGGARRLAVRGQAAEGRPVEACSSCRSPSGPDPRWATSSSASARTSPARCTCSASDEPGPSGTTGRVYRLARPSG